MAASRSELEEAEGKEQELVAKGEETTQQTEAALAQREVDKRTLGTLEEAKVALQASNRGVFNIAPLFENGAKA